MKSVFEGVEPKDTYAILEVLPHLNFGFGECLYFEKKYQNSEPLKLSEWQFLKLYNYQIDFTKNLGYRTYKYIQSWTRVVLQVC